MDWLKCDELVFAGTLTQALRQAAAAWAVTVPDQLPLPHQELWTDMCRALRVCIQHAQHADLSRYDTCRLIKLHDAGTQCGVVACWLSI